MRIRAVFRLEPEAGRLDLHCWHHRDRAAEHIAFGDTAPHDLFQFVLLCDECALLATRRFALPPTPSPALAQLMRDLSEYEYRPKK